MRKYLLIPILSLVGICSILFVQKAYATSYDFTIDSNTNISYTTGDDFVIVSTEYIRSVKNSSYYYPASGEKVFNLPDLPGGTDEQTKEERAYKLESLKVTDNKGNDIKYTTEQGDNGKGVYIHVPNYKQTTSSAPYDIQVRYSTHDFLTKIGNYISIQAPALPSDVKFSSTDSETNTNTQYNYGLTITVDKNITPLAKVFPSKYTTDTNASGTTTYTFTQEDRIGNSPYLEFGTSLTYKFELTYTTPKTDNLLPANLTNSLKALSTNIFELALPREFDETSQKVYFTNISPTPTNIYKDDEGNIIASFEMPANQESLIKVEGYIVVNQNTIGNEKGIDISWEDYKKQVSSTSYLQKYLVATKYWQATDSYIQSEASTLLNGQNSTLDILKADYAYIGGKLTYDTTKANSENERIGALAALQGGASVCMEYADSMIAILRAQGIPARAAFGYTNLKEAQNMEITHEWVQVWIPDMGWISIDPTYESNNMSIGQKIDKVLWEVFNNDSLSAIKVYSADNVTSLSTEGYKVNIYEVDSSSIDFSTLKTYINLIPGKGYNSTSDIPQEGYDAGQWFNTFLKTTVVGKSLLITGPIILLVLLIAGVLTIIKVVRKKFGKNKKEKEGKVVRYRMPRM
jgi:transglutaminase-like putative cysteine protease